MINEIRNSMSIVRDTTTNKFFQICCIECKIDAKWHWVASHPSPTMPTTSGPQGDSNFGMGPSENCISTSMGKEVGHPHDCWD